MSSSSLNPLVYQLNDAIAKDDHPTMTWILGKIQGPQINEGDNNANTTLHKACGRLNNPVAVAALLRMPGIDVNKKNFMGYTPIMFSAGRCNRESLVLLLDDHRVDLEATTRDGRKLEDVVGIDWGSEDQREKIIKLIQDEKTRREILENKQEYFKEGYKLSEINVSLNSRESLKEEEYSTPTKKELEEVRDTVKKQYKTKIDEFKEKIAAKERNVQEKELEKERLKEKQTYERKNVVEKLRQEMKELELRMRRDIDETDTKHREEIDQLDQCQQIELDRKSISSMRGTVEKLIKDFNNLDFEAGTKKADVKAAREDMECPVCLETMRPPTRIWMCPSTHLICESCRHSLDANICPTCRSEQITIRAYFAENMARNLFSV